MREPIVLLLLCAGLVGGCASPRAIGRGDLTSVTGASAMAHSGLAARPEDAYARAVQRSVLNRLGASQNDGAALFLVQIGVARSLPGVGVSSAADPSDTQAWRSAGDAEPRWRFWARSESRRAVTMAVVDTRNGRTIAWSSTEVREEAPEITAERLLKALDSAPKL